MMELSIPELRAIRNGLTARRRELKFDHATLTPPTAEDLAEDGVCFSLLIRANDALALAIQLEQEDKPSAPPDPIAQAKADQREMVRLLEAAGCVNYLVCRVSVLVTSESGDTHLSTIAEVKTWIEQNGKVSS